MICLNSEPWDSERFSMISCWKSTEIQDSGRWFCHEMTKPFRCAILLGCCSLSTNLASIAAKVISRGLLQVLYLFHAFAAHLARMRRVCDTCGKEFTKSQPMSSNPSSCTHMMHIGPVKENHWSYARHICTSMTRIRPMIFLHWSYARHMCMHLWRAYDQCSIYI